MIQRYRWPVLPAGSGPIEDDTGDICFYADHLTALAEKETANEILRNMNKHFCEEHEVLRQQIATLEAEKKTWKCYKCGFSTSDKAQAEAHFGGEEGEVALCVEWAAMDKSERLQTYQAFTEEINQTRNDNIALETAVEEKDEQIAALKAENLNLYEANRKTIERQAEEILAQEKELEITTGSWATAANTVEAQIKQIAALKDEVKGCRDWTADAVAVNERQAAQIAELKEALEHILPMAKGYAAEHPVGNNQKIVNEVQILKAEPDGEPICPQCGGVGTFSQEGCMDKQYKCVRCGHVKTESEAIEIHLPGCLCEGCNPKWKLNKAGSEPEKGEKG